MLNRGNILFEQKKYDSALSEAKNVLSVEPNHVPALHLLANCYLHLGQEDKADEAIESAVRADPTDYLSLYLKSAILMQKGQFEKALKFINNSISFQPFSAVSFGLRAAIFFELARFNESLESANDGLAVEGDNLFCLNQRAKALQKLGLKAESYDTIREALHEDPENSYTHANLGYSMLENGDSEAAKKHFREALRLDPNNEYARQGMLHAIKSTNWFYDIWLKYVFWLQGISPKARIIFVVGAYILFRFLSSVKDSFGPLEFVADIVLIAYALFAVSSWIIEPISNMFLRLHPFGKYVLSDEEKKISNYTILMSLLAVTGLVLLLIALEDTPLWNIGLYLACYGIAFMIVVSAFGSRSDEQSKKKIKITGGIFMAFAFLVVLVGFVDPQLSLSMFNISVWMFVAFQFYVNTLR